MDVVRYCRHVYSSSQRQPIPSQGTIVPNGDCEPLLKTFEGVHVVPCLRRNVTVPPWVSRFLPAPDLAPNTFLLLVSKPRRFNTPSPFTPALTTLFTLFFICIALHCPSLTLLLLRLFVCCLSLHIQFSCAHSLLGQLNQPTPYFL